MRKIASIMLKGLKLKQIYMYYEHFLNTAYVVVLVLENLSTHIKGRLFKASLAFKVVERLTCQVNVNFISKHTGGFFVFRKMSCVVRKPAFCICENKRRRSASR